MTVYDKGDVLRITGTFTDIDGNFVDPTIVSFFYRTPTGTMQIYSFPGAAQVVRTSAGVYYSDLPFTESGIWCVAFRSTGTGQAAAEKNYFVRSSCF